MDRSGEEAPVEGVQENGNSPSVSRRGLLSQGGPALAGALLLGGVAAEAAPAKRGKGRGKGRGKKGGKLTLEVAPNLSSFDAVRSAAPGKKFPTGPFYIEGTIYPGGSLNVPAGTPKPGAQAIGTFRCWGWIFNPDTGAAVVAQAFELAKGEIQVQGLEDDRRPVTGGSGKYRNVRGEGKVQVINADNLAFRIGFKLLG